MDEFAPSLGRVPSPLPETVLLIQGEEEKEAPHRDYTLSFASFRNGLKDCRSLAGLSLFHRETERKRQREREREKEKNQDTIWHLRRLNDFLPHPLICTGKRIHGVKITSGKMFMQLSLFSFASLSSPLVQMNDYSCNL